MKRILKSLACLGIIFSLGSFLVLDNRISKTSRENSGAVTAVQQEPTVTIEETNTVSLIVVYVTDSAGSSAAITQKFMQIIPVELGGFLKKNNLQMAGPPTAWYYGTQFPFVFDIGVPVNKLPASTEGRIRVKQLPAGKAVVAHYYGPYDQISKGYTVATAWIKEHSKMATAPPYEVYIGDPGAEKDPYKVLTNIVFPVQ
jgi:effector-binding domain-containing protein